MPRDVLVVDLDGSLLRSNILFECIARIATTHPWLLLLAPFWLIRGKTHLKAKLAAHAKLTCDSLPYREAVLELVRQARRSGTTTVLATASHQSIAEEVARTLAVFDEVIGSDERHNRKGSCKLSAIRHCCGDRAFDYVGDNRADRVIWKEARRAYVVNAPGEFGRLKRLHADAQHLDDGNGSRVLTLLKALRFWQWSKNALLFVPALFAGELANPSSLATLAIAFTAFSLIASSIYLLNDLLDLEDDRQHPTKRLRPMASGQLDLVWGILGCPALLIAGLGASAIWLPMTFTWLLVAYAALNLAYNFWLKRVAVMDVLALSMLYTLRLLAGGAALDIEVSHWLLAFSMFVFLSLAMAKRGTELRLDGAESGRSRRGYIAQDLQSMVTLGSASGYVSMVVLALYIQSPEVAERYNQPQALWLICPVLLFWISRIWLIVNRGEMRDDPVEFSIKDRPSWMCAVACLGIVAAAMSGGHL